jgi:hypothetical protein
MMKLRPLVIVIATIACVPRLQAQAQAQTPPPSQTADAGPSLEATMMFLQDKLKQQGPVSVTAHVHDNAAGTSWTVQHGSEYSNVVADPTDCKLSFHAKTITNGTITAEGDDYILLGEAEEIVVLPIEQDWRDNDTRHGHAAWIYSADPGAFVLRLNLKLGDHQSFYFYDADSANRVAKAIVHAVELCSVGSQPGF